MLFVSLYSMCFSQSKLGSIFDIDTLPTFSLITSSTPNLLLINSTNHFQMQDVNEFSFLISNREIQSTLFLEAFNSPVYRSMFLQIKPLFVLSKSVQLHIGFEYFNSWYKTFGSDNYVDSSIGLSIKSGVELSMSINSSIDESCDVKLAKRFDSFAVQLRMLVTPFYDYKRFTIMNRFEELNVFIGIQNGDNMFLSGISFQMNNLLFRFSYEEYTELGNRTHFSLGYFY